MIPSFDQSGFLPPFIGDSPAVMSNCSPYKTSLFNFTKTFATSSERKNILKQLLTYRSKLKEIGIVDGFQWINGSFAENVEKNKDRPPKDIDLLTFATRPKEIENDKQWDSFMNSHKEIFFPQFFPQEARKLYLCDAYFIDLNLPPWFLVKQTSYWFGLFSHQRETYIWKGIIELNIHDDEKDAEVLLSNGEINAS